MTVDAVAAHEHRLATLDPLLPGTHPLPEARPDDVRLASALDHLAGQPGRPARVGDALMSIR